MNSKKTFYTTLNGKEVPIRAVSLYELQLAEDGLKQEYLDRGEPLEPPVYRVDLKGGGQQEFPHDETTIRTDEEKEMWAAYQDALERFTDDANRLRGEIVLEDGIPLSLPDDTSWMDKQKRRHIRFPEDPAELRLHWLMTEILQTNEDILGVIGEVLKVSAKGAADPAAVEAAIDGFLRPLPTNGEEQAETPPGSNGQEKSVET